MSELTGLLFSGASSAGHSDNATPERVFPCTLEELQKRIASIDALPTLPAILMRLMSCLERSPAETDLDEVIELISGDQAIAAQCVRMANSAMFSRRRHIESVQEAVISLGLWRIGEIVFSCSLPDLFTHFPKGIDRNTFWRHSMACALVSQRLARAVRSVAADKAYLAGLLHDIGILVNATLLPEANNAVLQRASSQLLALDVVEREMLGFTHAESGALLGQAWQLPPDIVSVIQYHHEVEGATTARDLVALVHLSDLFCREHDLGYGYHEARRIDFTCSPGWLILVQTCRQMGRPHLAKLFQELEDYYGEMVTLVDGFFAPASRRPAAPSLK